MCALVYILCYVNHVHYVSVGHVYMYEMVCLVHTFCIMGKHSQTVVRYKIMGVNVVCLSLRLCNI